MKKHKKLKIFGIIFAVFLALLGIAALIWYNFFFVLKDTVSDPVDTLPLTDEISSQAAIEDLDYVYHILTEKHPCFIDGSDIPDRVKASYEAERSALQERETITVCDLWRAAARMLNTIGDGHTISQAYSADPLFVNDLTVFKDANVTAIDGVPVNELLEDFKTVFSYETEVSFYADYMFYHRIILRERYLQLLGIDTSDGVDFTFDVNGETTVQHLSFTTADNVIGLDESRDEFYDMQYDEERSLAVFTFDEFVESEEYTNALAEFFKTVKEKNIRNIAVDLRTNGGGTSNATVEFMQYIDVDRYLLFGGVDVRNGSFLTVNSNCYTENEKNDLLFDGNIYVLTSNNTFSTAMDFACLMQDNAIGTVIGEVCGNMPTAYGDKLNFQCPNSKLFFQVSYKKFHRIDGTKDSEPLIPDYEVDADNAFDTLYDILSGTD